MRAPKSIRRFLRQDAREKIPEWLHGERRRWYAAKTVFKVDRYIRMAQREITSSIYRSPINKRMGLLLALPSSDPLPDRVYVRATEPDSHLCLNLKPNAAYIRNAKTPLELIEGQARYHAELVQARFIREAYHKLMRTEKPKPPSLVVKK